MGEVICGGFKTDEPEAKAEAKLGEEPVDPLRLRHHFNGPIKTKRLDPPERHRTLQGAATFEWAYDYYVDPAYLGGLTRAYIVNRLRGVLRDQRGLASLGVWARFVNSPEGANAIVRVHPQGDMTCGVAGYSCVHTINSVAYIDFKAPHLEGVRAINHEAMGHAVFRACDMKKWNPGGYVGLMDTGVEGTEWPTAEDFRSFREWLIGGDVTLGC